MFGPESSNGTFIKMEVLIFLIVAVNYWFVTFCCLPILMFIRFASVKKTSKQTFISFMIFYDACVVLVNVHVFSSLNFNIVIGLTIDKKA
jgi:hypothetical protein